MTQQLSVIPKQENEPEKIGKMHPQTLSVQMQSLMKLICGDFGLTYPPKEVMARICEILFTTKGHWDLADVRTMFQLNLFNKLDAFYYRDNKGGPDKHHYSKMTPEYWMKVTGAYERYMQDNRMRLGSKDQLLLSEKKITRQDNEDAVIRHLKNMCDWFEKEYPKPFFMMGHKNHWKIFLRLKLVPPMATKILCYEYLNRKEFTIFHQGIGCTYFSKQYEALIMAACEIQKQREKLGSKSLRKLMEEAYGYKL